MAVCKTNKSAIIIAVMIILLCLSSVAGATLALFTFTTEDGKIGINATSGSFKVDIIDPDNAEEENPPSLLGDVLSFYTKDESGVALFEPGAVYRTQGFCIYNKSEIPMRYIIHISEDAELMEKFYAKYGEDFYDSFDVWLTDDPGGAGDLIRLRDFEGHLEAGKSSKPYYLVFRMKEIAGNKFQGEEIYTGVGITVCVVQSNGSFGAD